MTGSSLLLVVLSLNTSHLTSLESVWSALSWVKKGSGSEEAQFRLLTTDRYEVHYWLLFASCYFIVIDKANKLVSMKLLRPLVNDAQKLTLSQ